MSTKNSKDFGVWMDARHATVIGKEDGDGAFTVLGHLNNSGPDNNSNENAANHQEIALTQKYFRQIAAIMPNIDRIHVTGTGQVQEQFIRFLSETPQYKKVVATESTSNKMSDEILTDFITKHFN